MFRVAPSAARTALAIVALSCVFGAGPAAASDVGSVRFTLGYKRLSSDWHVGAPEVTAVGDTTVPRASQPALGLELTWGRSGWPALVALDVLHSYDDGLQHFQAISLGSLVIPPANVRRRASTLEVGLGLRRPWNVKGLSPYIGAGGSWVRATVMNEMSDPSQNQFGGWGPSNHAQDWGFGYWAGGGVYRRMGPRLQIGLTGRYSKAKLTIPETVVVGENGGYRFVPGDRTTIEAGGTHFGLVAGWSFPARK